MVLRDDGPAIGELLDLTPSGVDHRLDREDHAGRQFLERAGPAVVKDLRLLVEFLADAVPAKLAHHAVAVLFGMRLNRMADVTYRGAGTHLTDPEPHAVIGHLG